MDEFKFPYFSIFNDDFYKILGKDFNSRRDVSQIDKEKSKNLTKDMICRFPHKFIPYSITTFNKNYISCNSLYLYIIYSNITKEMSEYF